MPVKTITVTRWVSLSIHLSHWVRVTVDGSPNLSSMNNTSILSVRPCTVDELTSMPEWDALINEYADECSIRGLGPIDAQLQSYRQMESSGILYPLGAFLGEELIGFLSLLVSELPHYGRRVAISESLFIKQSARKSGAGLKLIRAGEKLAASLGAVGFLVSAPYGGKLAEVLPRAGFEETNRVFFRSLSC